MNASASTATLWSRLISATLAYVILVVAHDLDHIVNEGTLYDLSTFFWVLLPFQYGVILAVTALVLRRDPRAPLLAGVLGLFATVAFIVVHALPFGPAAYTDTEAGLFNWLLVFIPAAVALYMGITGLRLNAAISPTAPATTGY